MRQDGRVGVAEDCLDCVFKRSLFLFVCVTVCYVYAGACKSLELQSYLVEALGSACFLLLSHLSSLNTRFCQGKQLSLSFLPDGFRFREGDTDALEGVAALDLSALTLFCCGPCLETG